MLQTNLIGRRYHSRLDKSVLTCVALYVAQGQLYIVGETQKGSLVTYTCGEVSLIESPRADQPEDLLGVV